MDRFVAAASTIFAAPTASDKFSFALAAFRLTSFFGVVVGKK